MYPTWSNSTEAQKMKSVICDLLNFLFLYSSKLSQTNLHLCVMTQTTVLTQTHRSHWLLKIILIYLYMIK